LRPLNGNGFRTADVANITGVPFAAGCPRPLVRQIEVAPDIHGESGLDGPVLPEPTLALEPRHAVDLIIDTLMAHPPGSVTLVP
ncbi:nucleoside hydrolase, partial [Paraburkholderia sp. SIMBA_061]